MRDDSGAAFRVTRRRARHRARIRSHGDRLVGSDVVDGVV
ncbi:hypothetical protein D805_1178 [Bifidobacterium thermophilum RBL67]|uniref:Uncharacterized protein n=1 Tax=Bifidobacterium thermophilum RBL67 TaxID=1254439 RepID=M4RD80_9BIFI|nr:hypothetical protein D805_1178 [Bifidobacterium thermophilum RBL67]